MGGAGWVLGIGYCVLRAGGGSSPLHDVSGQAAAVAAGGPGDSEGGRDGAHGVARHEDGAVAAQRDGDGYRRHHVHGDRVGDLGGAASDVGGFGGDGVGRAVRQGARPQIPGQAPHARGERSRTIAAYAGVEPDAILPHGYLHPRYPAGVGDQSTNIQPPGLVVVRIREQGGGDDDGRRQQVNRRGDGVAARVAVPIGDCGLEHVRSLAGRLPGGGPKGFGDCAVGPGVGVDDCAVYRNGQGLQ